ncbi:uncharacterized protein [Typha latifolia]|uniref:uncharacterized protein n=1 Tax=Typha latifolia TaxID=4733 RepID=UPI003C2BCFB3
MESSLPPPQPPSSSAISSSSVSSSPADCPLMRRIGRHEPKAQRAKKVREPKLGRNVHGKRTSIYRGVTRHRWTGKYEAHLWDKDSWIDPEKKGKQIHLGGYDNEEMAAHTYDLAALKLWKDKAILNFPVSTYEREIQEMENISKVDYLISLRRRSNGFARGASKYRGVAKHHNEGRWEARIGHVSGYKYLYLGSFDSQEKAAEAYDRAAIHHRGSEAVTNFARSNYINNPQVPSEPPPPPQQQLPQDPPNPQSQLLPETTPPLDQLQAPQLPQLQQLPQLPEHDANQETDQLATAAISDIMPELSWDLSMDTTPSFEPFNIPDTPTSQPQGFNYSFGDGIFNDGFEGLWPDQVVEDSNMQEHLSRILGYDSVINEGQEAMAAVQQGDAVIGREEEASTSQAFGLFGPPFEDSVCFSPLVDIFS